MVKYELYLYSTNYKKNTRVIIRFNTINKLFKWFNSNIEDICYKYVFSVRINDVHFMKYSKSLEYAITQELDNIYMEQFYK